MKFARVVFVVFPLLSIVLSSYSQNDSIRSGRALAFDGVDDYINFGDRYSDLTFPFTISAWVYLDASGKSAPIFASRNCDPVYQGFRLIINPTNISLEYGDGSGSGSPAYRGGKFAFVDNLAGRWNHVTAVVRGVYDINLYLNGVNVPGSFTGSSSSPMVSNKPGGFASTAYFISNDLIYRYKGLIDDIRFWNRALEEEEIRRTMGIKLTGNEPGLIGYWDFNEPTGDVILDKSPNHFNGQFVGSPRRVLSSVPIGDFSTYQNSARGAGKTLSIEEGDHSFTIKNVTESAMGAQPLSFQVENYGITEGLPSNEIYQVYQDKKGFIWFATDNGVVRFDGKEMKTFHIKQGLVDPVVFGFHEDANGRIWFRSFSGKLAYFKNDSIFEYGHNKIISSLVRKNLIHSLHHDEDETMWLPLGREIISINKTGELSRQEFNELTIFYKSFGSNSNIVGSECVPYVANSINLNGKEYPLKLTGKSYANNVIQSIHWNDKLLISIGKNIFSYDGVSFTNILESSNLIISLSKDNQNNLWVGYLNQGVEKYSNPKFNDGWTPPFLAKLSVTKVLEDKEGGMWFSTLEKGVFYEPKQNIRIFTLPYQSKINAVTKNPTWILAGNLDGKLIALDPDTKEKVWEKKFDYPIISLFTDRQKNTWISTGVGTFEFNKNFESPRGPAEATMVDFTESSDGILWAVGGDRGSRIIKINGQNRITYRQLKDSYRAICVTDSLIYLAGRTGLEIYSKEIRYLDSPSKLLNLKITEILQVNDTTLFLATSGSGFLLMNEKTLATKQFDTENNLMANNIYCALINHSQLWMGTENGVIKTDLQDLLKGQPSFHYLNKKSGLANDKTNQLTATQNSIWAFTEDKISIIPDSLQNFSNTNPTFYLKSALVNQVPFDLIKYPELSHDQNDIVISFGFISFNNNENIRARFRLSPKDPWVYAENRELQFYSLSPGSYALSLEYSMDNHHWIAAIDPMIFFINPPWWRAWYYQLMGLLIAAFSVLLYFKWRLRRSRKQQQKLLQTEIQITERERSRIAKDLHDTVGTNLAAVKMAVSQLLRKHHEPLSETIESQLQEIIKETKEIIYHLVPPGLERLGLFVLTQNHIAKLNHTAQSVINLSTSGNDVFNAHLNIVILRIIQELLSNSLKHAQATVITIAINTFENHLNFLYEDNGVGFNRSEIKEGLGLVNIHSRVESLQGNIKFDTGPSGTSYTINIPYPNSGNRD